MSGGHEAVKADIVEHISDNIAAWIAVTSVADWPPVPALVSATDILPVDEDKPWPCVMVASTSMTDPTRTTSIGDGTFIGEYSVKITAAVRTSKSKDDADAAVGRDRLLLALRYLLITSPQAGENTTVLAASLTEQTDPVAVDPKGRMVALGSISVNVRHVETVPDLASYGEADSAEVHLAVTDADGTLYTNAEYNSDVAYDDTNTDYEGGTEWPPKS